MNLCFITDLKKIKKVFFKNKIFLVLSVRSHKKVLR